VLAEFFGPDASFEVATEAPGLAKRTFSSIEEASAARSEMEEHTSELQSH